MQCMKCGRDLESGQVFCDVCRKTMEKYPVRPNVVVQLPHRAAQSAKKQQTRRRQMPTPEEQNQILRRIVRWQILLNALLLAAVIGLSWLVVNLYRENEDKVLPGQNYYAATEPADTTLPTEAPTEDPEYGVAG